MNKKAKELNLLNNELDSKIAPENEKSFTDIICYLRGSNLSELDQELVRHDLLEMVLSAQERGEKIDSVIGEDYKEFCDDIIANLPPKTVKQKLADFFDTACWSLSILGIITILFSPQTIGIIKNIFSKQSLNFNISISLGNILMICSVIALAVFIFEYITKNSFKDSKSKKSAIIKSILAALGIILVFLVTVHLRKIILFNVNIFIALLIVIVLYIAHKVLERI